MRRILSIILLITVLFQSTSRLWILVSFYAKQDYISKNICINRFDLIPVCEGQCYLTNQLKKTEPPEQNIPEIKLKDIQLFFTDIDVFYLTFFIVRLCFFSAYSISGNHLNGFLSSIFQPPREAYSF